MAGRANDDLPTMIKLPVEVYVPADLLSEVGKLSAPATELMKAVVDCALIPFYYLLQVGEYTITIKTSRNSLKQTQQFKLEDCTFFERNALGHLCQLPRRASDEKIMAVLVSATLKLDNQKNGWKGVCVHQEANGEDYNCPVHVLGHSYCYIICCMSGSH